MPRRWPAQIERLFNRFMTEEDVVLSRAERGKVFDQVCAEILGYRPDPATAEQRRDQRDHGQRAAPGLDRAERASSP